MTTISVTDDGGDEMTLFNFNGYIYPTFPSGGSVLQNLPSVKIRPDDIIINSYPKSGTHWVYEMIRLLVSGKLDSEDTNKIAGMLEYAEEAAYRDLPSPRILNTHVLFRHLPLEVKMKKPRLVYMTRNPKDVAVSYYNFIKKLSYYGYTGEWKNYLKPAVEGKLAYGSWFDYAKDWEEAKKTTDIPILSVSYEDLKENTVREGKRLREFLAVDRSDEFLKQVCDSCNFTSMKKMKTRGDVVYRKGQVGDWKNWFTVAQNEWFDQLYEEKMKNSQIKFRFTLHDANSNDR